MQYTALSYCTATPAPVTLAEPSPGPRLPGRGPGAGARGPEAAGGGGGRNRITFLLWSGPVGPPRHAPHPVTVRKEIPRGARPRGSTVRKILLCNKLGKTETRDSFRQIRRYIATCVNIAHCNNKSEDTALSYCWPKITAIIAIAMLHKPGTCSLSWRQAPMNFLSSFQILDFLAVSRVKT
jgi:hypothetical protein